MDAIERCIDEQRRTAEWLAVNGHDAPESALARLGASDWMMEEVLLLEQESDKGYEHDYQSVDRYKRFLESKQVACKPSGFVVSRDAINPVLFEWQKDIVVWAMKRGKAALFEDCGLGKTFQQLEWAKHVSVHTGQSVLIFAPLAVAEQTQDEGRKLGINVTICATASDIKPGVNITNYEKLHHFTADGLGGIVLDESSILKGFDGKTRKLITEFAETIPYRLCCTATPAPNDYMELGNHAEFLGVMRMTEMLSMFFVHDGGDTSKWRLKGHAEMAFWKWVCSWAVAIRKPSDLGYEDGAFILPKLHMHQVTVETEAIPEGFLFPVEGNTLQERNAARRSTIIDRVIRCARTVEQHADEPWVIWCNLNDESKHLASAITDSIEVRGGNPKNEQLIHNFMLSDHHKLVSKPSICGFGLNLQFCRYMAFVGLSDSYEQLYQAIRRCWRFGQLREVHCFIITSQIEGAVVRNIQRKEREAIEMMDAMVEHMKEEMQREVRGLVRETSKYETGSRSGEGWDMKLGDCVEHVAAIPNESIDYSIFSPPFASLYTYSNSDRDMGNSRDFGEFSEHFGYLIRHLYRVTKPGRLLSFHCMNLPLSKERDGVIGIRDFRGLLIRWFIGDEAAELDETRIELLVRASIAKDRGDVARYTRLIDAAETIRVEIEKYPGDKGFIYHSEVVIWKDPVTAMQRTKALGLLYKQLRKDSCMSRQGIPDCLVTMRKPGVNPDPVTKTHEGFPVDRWQNYASPVWMDINPSDTLQRESARQEEDERHICLAAGSLVLTREHGYIGIEEVAIGDRVLTHMGRWMPVTAKRCNGVADVIKVCAQGVADLRVTPDHKLWARKARSWDAKAGAMETYSHWMEAQSTIASYLNLQLPPEEESPLSAEEWWIVGRWLGDGHRGGHERSGARGGVGQFLISCAHDEADELIERLGRHAGHVATVTATQIAVVDVRREVREVLDRCGRGAKNKHLPGEAVTLCAEKSEALLSGYLSADGHYVAKHDRHMASSVSRSLLLGMAIVAQRCRNVVASVYAGRPERTGLIQGREVSMSQDWIFAFRNSDGYRKSGWIDNGGAWKKVRKIELAGEESVWDLQVAEDSSFTAEGAVVHNCPLQLQVIERAIELWTNPGDLVLSPFAGIGSEGHVALHQRRRFVGIELKRSYYEQACRNLEIAAKSSQHGLFSTLEEEPA